MQNTAMFAENIGLCQFYEFIRYLYEKVSSSNKEYTEIGDGVTALVYKPKEQRSNKSNTITQVVVHGGGFIYGSPMTVAKFSENLCNALGNDVIALKYPLAPEESFPTPLIYVTKAIKMLCYQYSEVHLVGVSAGANLALSACLLLKDIGEIHAPTSLILIGGPYSVDTGSWSYAMYGNGPKLTKFMICQYWSLYLQSDQMTSKELYNKRFQLEGNKKVTSLHELLQHSEAYLTYSAPLNSSFIFNLPKTVILVAEEDTLFSDSVALYRKLRNENSEVLLKVYPGPHIHLAEENGSVERDIIRIIKNNVPT